MLRRQLRGDPLRLCALDDACGRRGALWPVIGLFVGFQRPTQDALAGRATGRSSLAHPFQVIVTAVPGRV
eukprot:4105351-Prymnesium_polylepis.1